MHTGEGQLTEIVLRTNGTGGRIVCPPELVPAAGQFLFAHDGSDAPLPVTVFMGGASPGGFLAAPPLPPSWGPGLKLRLRGPLGRGFSIPPRVRRVALLALDDAPARLLPLIPFALELGAAVTLVCERTPEDVPDEVESQTPATLTEVLAWADFLAVDTARESLSDWREKLRGFNGEAQILVRTSMPCGGVAECGVCAVTLRSGWGMACKDGPVFDLEELLF